MGWEGIVAIVSCVGLLLSIAAMVYALGKLVARLEALEGRVCEDRKNNENQHKEFIASMGDVRDMKIHLQYIRGTLDDMKGSIGTLLKYAQSQNAQEVQ